MTISILITPLIWLCSSDFSWVSGPYIKLLPWLFTAPQNKCFQNWTYCLCLNPFPKPLLHLTVFFFKCSVLWMEMSLMHLAPGGNVAIISDFTFCITWIFNHREFPVSPPQSVLDPCSLCAHCWCSAPSSRPLLPWFPQLPSHGSAHECCLSCPVCLPAMTREHSRPRLPLQSPSMNVLPSE